MRLSTRDLTTQNIPQGLHVCDVDDILWEDVNINFDTITGDMRQTMFYLEGVCRKCERVFKAFFAFDHFEGDRTEDGGEKLVIKNIYPADLVGVEDF